MVARIYKPAKTAMQQGGAGTREWVLDYEPASPREIEPLMGWTSSDDTRSQVRMQFATLEEAVAYATRHGIAVSRRRAAEDGDQAEVLCGQLQIRPPRPLDALASRFFGRHPGESRGPVFSGAFAPLDFGLRRNDDRRR